MQIENRFQVAAPPDTVFGFLLDVNRVVGCMPGAELSEVVDDSTFKGRVKIKVGPITVSYNGTAHIAERDDAARRAVLVASGRETTGPGSANATATMTVEPDGAASTVVFATEYTVAGRVANFGRGVMEDVSRRLVGQMAECIKAQLETVPAGAPPAASEAGKAPAPAPVEGGFSAPTPAAQAEPARPVPAAIAQPAKPVNALSLFFGILWDRIRALFGGRK